MHARPTRTSPRDRRREVLQRRLAAFEYERQWFDPAVDNWPDFRRNPFPSNRGRSPVVFMEYWCHGAPGIALSRLRAFQLLQDETLRSEALAGLRTTSRMIAASLVRNSGNFSLCHGLLGNAGVIGYAREILDAGSVDDGLVESVASAGIERFRTAIRPGLAGPTQVRHRTSCWACRASAIRTSGCTTPVSQRFS